MSVVITFSNTFKELQAEQIIPSSIMPAYNGESSCIDLYYAGKEKMNIPSALQYPQLTESWKSLIPTGLFIALKPSQTALILERGSITKTTLKVRAGVIDPGYTGEIFVNAINLHQAQQYILTPGMKLPFQLLVVHHDNDFVEVTQEEYKTLASSRSFLRKHGSVGSSDAS